jgi:hypothetical protein
MVTQIWPTLLTLARIRIVAPSAIMAMDARQARLHRSSQALVENGGRQ